MSEKTTLDLVPGTGSQNYTFLVGEHVYLRTFAPGDEKNATSWRNSIFPKSPELVEKWIKEELPNEGKRNRGHLAIVRKSDDVLIGSISCYFGDVSVFATPHVDPLYGEKGQRWLAEAIVLAAKWQVDENFSAALYIDISSDMQVTIDEVIASGFVETARFREMYEKNGNRYDQVKLYYFNAAWVERLGSPMETVLPRTGSGEVRPVPAKTVLEGDPPVNAVMVGARIYLRPEDKKDAEKAANASRMEEESFWDIGRHLVPEAKLAVWMSEGRDDDHPRNIWFSVCLRENDEVIGSVGMLNVDFVNRTGETGSFFHEAKWRGGGYGSEAKQLLLEYIFDVLGFHMVQSFVYFPNTRSAAALRKQGYREAGRACWLYTYEGGFGNMVVFDLLADEWRALPRG